MSVIRTGVRWLLVPVSAAAVLAICIVAARWAVAVADRRCPVESMVAGSCVEPWHTTVVEIVIYVGCALAALGIVVLPAVLAPQFDRAVGVLALIGVVILAGSGYFLLGWADLLLPLLIAGTAGGTALVWVWLRSSADAA